MGTHNENDYNASNPHTASGIAGSSETPPAHSKPGGIGERGDENGDTGPLVIGRRGYGFPRGCYFLIKERGTDSYLLNDHLSSVEGTPLHLWPLQPADGTSRKNQLFYIDETGALCHAISGLAADILDNVPVLRRRHLMTARPNPWSHPLPIFTYEDSQIRVNFLSDPAMPICSEEIYPNEAWKSQNLVLVAHFKKRSWHRHIISDFAPWIPRNIIEAMPWAQERPTDSANPEERWNVLVEEGSRVADGDKTLWDIIPTFNSKTSVEVCLS